MKKIVKKFLFTFFIFLNLNYLHSIAQTDTSFWFAAPCVTPQHEQNFPIIFHFTSFGQPATVTISMPAYPGFTPIVTDVPANQMVNVPVTLWKDLLENSPGDSILPKGIHITATSPVTAYYQVGQGQNSEIFTLKGKNSLGTNFVIPGQNKYNIAGANNYGGTARSAIDIVATEDNTKIKIILSNNAQGVIKWTKTEQTDSYGRYFSCPACDYTCNVSYDAKLFTTIQTYTSTDNVIWVPVGPPVKTWSIDSARYSAPNGCHEVTRTQALNPVITQSSTVHAAGDTITIILNKGNSYSVIAASTLAAGQLVGTIVTSDKPIAVSIKDDSMNLDHCYDLIGDQIVPTDVTGTDYIAIKGNFTNPGWEGVFITATQEATDVTVNGTNVTTINTGATYFAPMTAADTTLYIKTSKPAYAFQLTGDGCEAAGSVLPQLICTGSQKVAFSRVTNDEFYLKLLANKNIVNSFYYSIDNGVRVHIDSTKFFPVPSTDFMYARILINATDIPANRQCVVENDKGIFQMGFINMTAGTQGALQGYFSNFGFGGSSTSNQKRFAGCEITLSIPPSFTQYTWLNENRETIISDHSSFSIRFKITNKIKDTIVYSIASNGACADTVKFVVTPTVPVMKFNQKLCTTGADSVSLTFDPTKYYHTGFKWLDSLQGDSTHIQIKVKLPQKDTVFKLWLFDYSCIAPADSFVVNFYPKPNILLPRDTIICNGNPLKIYNLKTNPPDLPFSSRLWSWPTGSDKDPTHDTLIPVTTVPRTDSAYYKLTIRMCNDSLSFSDSMKVVVMHNVKPITDTRYVSCSVDLKVDSGKVFYNWYSFKNKIWTKLNSDKYNISVMSPDSVLMNVSNAGICNDTNYFYLQYKKPHAGFDKIYCGSTNDGTLLHFNPTECLFPNAVFRWFDRNNGNSTDTAQYVKQAGIYHVYFWDGKCLADSGKFTVSFYSKPEIHLNPPAPVCSDSAVTLDAGNQLGMKIQWTLDGISDPKDTNQTIRITLPSNKQSTSTMIICTLSATNRCDTSRTATVNVSFIPCNIEIPNVFTPNGDGINDYLYIKNVDNINYMNWEVIIFNRWGRKVYETNNYINEDQSHSWNGDGSPEGVYYYVVRNSKNNQHYSGYVELIR